MSGAPLVPLFVYGTLRPGQPLERYSWRAKPKDKTFARGYLKGHALYWNRWHSFPYMVKTGNPRDVVRGTWFEALNESALHDILEIELGSGYDLDEVYPTWGRTGEAGMTYAFTVKPSDLRSLGATPLPLHEDPVYNGMVYDWVRAVDDWEQEQVPGVEEIQTISRLPLAKDS